MKSTTYPSLAIATLCLLLAGVALAQEEVSLEADAAVETTRQAEQGAARAEIQANQRAAAEAREAAVTQRAEVRASTSQARGEQQAEIQQQRETRQAAISDRSRERITNLAANISNRMDAAAARIQNIITRLQSRIDKLSSAGLDTTEASAALASAQTSIDAAVVDLSRIDVTVQAAVTAENPRAAWGEVKAVYTSIRSELRTAHTELKASVQALKDAARTTDTERGSAAAVQNNTEVRADQESVSITSESEAVTE